MRGDLKSISQIFFLLHSIIVIKILFFFVFARVNHRFVETDLQSNACKANENQTCIGGYARIVSTVKQLKAKRVNPIYINVGDNFSGTIWYTIDRWNVTSHFLNLLPADVMVSLVPLDSIFSLSR